LSQFKNLIISLIQYKLKIMKLPTQININILLVLLIVLFNSCKQHEPVTNEPIPEKAKVILKSPIKEKPTPNFLGEYNGIQSSYMLKDKFGDDLILNGKKVPVPSAEYKYMFQKDNIVSMKQTNLENNSSYIYEGTYSIKSEDNKIFILECNLHYKQTDANPIHTIVINKIDKSATSKSDDGTNVELKFIK
jgi:hypothetical protein